MGEIKDIGNNVVALHQEADVAAQMLCDQHLSLMAITVSQVLCTVATDFANENIAIHMEKRIKEKILLPEVEELSKHLSEIASHKLVSDHPWTAVHPWVSWAKASRNNWEWLLVFGGKLCKEEVRRLGATPKAARALDWLYRRSLRPRTAGRTPFVQSVPDHYKRKKPAWAYRAYYWGTFSSCAKWERGQPAPKWWTDRAAASCNQVVGVGLVDAAPSPSLGELPLFTPVRQNLVRGPARRNR